MSILKFSLVNSSKHFFSQLYTHETDLIPKIFLHLRVLLSSQNEYSCNLHRAFHKPDLAYSKRDSVLKRAFAFSNTIYFGNLSMEILEKYLHLLKGQLHGRAEIFKGLKMTLRTKILKKNYTMLMSVKNTTNFFLLHS